MWPIILFFVAQWISSYSGKIGLNSCDPNPCLNGGICIEGVRSILCICPTYAFGTRCDFDSGKLNVRLINEYPNKYPNEYPNEYPNFSGRLEVKIGNEWGAVCAEKSSFQNRGKIAKVVCKTFGDRIAKSYRRLEELASKGKVVLESLKCNGDESSIEECSSTPGNKCAGDRITFACYQDPPLAKKPLFSN